MSVWQKIPYLTLIFFLPLFLSISCVIEEDSEDCDSCNTCEQGPHFERWSPEDEGSDDDSDDDDNPREFGVVVQYQLIDGNPADPNPITGQKTPDMYNKIPLFRYRQDTGDDPPREVNAILLCIAGYKAGASQFHIMAQDLVTLAEGNIEVWVIGRRTAFLEDQYGMDVAEEEKNPWLAFDYYFRGQELYGHTFDGWRDPYDWNLGYMSEWGVDLQFADFRKILHMIPEEYRRTNVFLAGHSMGVRSTMMYAGYEFEDGVIGSDELAGLILYDGRNDLEEASQLEYEANLLGIRLGTSSRFESEGVSPSFFYQLQFFAMAVQEQFANDDDRLGPKGHMPSWAYGIFGLVKPIITRFHSVDLTNDAFFGLAMDDASGLLQGGFTAHLGELAGGKIGYDSFGYYPAENGASYTWKHFNETTPEELVDMNKLARLLYEGPSDYIDAYYSSRLFIDHAMAGEMETEGTWQHDYVHYYSSRVDAPVICIKSEYIGTSRVYEKYRDKLAPARGSDLPRRNFGFDIIYVPTWSHLEVLAVEPDRNPIYDGILDWMDKFSDGTLQVPLFEE